jgi:hypothetical protein
LSTSVESLFPFVVSMCALFYAPATESSTSHGRINKLEKKGVVNETEPVSVEAVYATESYWEPPREPTSDWLYNEVLPSVRSFLRDHTPHRVVYGEETRLFGDDYAGEYLNWLQLGYCAELSPRALVEKLGLRNWEQVVDHLSRSSIVPWWWNEPTLCGKAREKFEALVQDLAQEPGSF